VLASRSPAKLDWIAAQCVGYDPRRIPYLVDGMQRTSDSNPLIEPQTWPLTVDHISHEGFEKLPYSSELGKRLDSIPHGLRRFAGSIIKLRPLFHIDPCIGCKACIEICPAKALEFERKDSNNVIRIDDRRCIPFFCCHESCPSNAISIGRAPFRIAHRPRSKRRS
jgi:ferredoxin